MPITKLSPANAHEANQEWTGAVHALFQQVQQWVTKDRPEWKLEFSTVDVTEASSGSYTIPVIEISAPNGRLMLEPVGRDVFGARGRIDLYAWPSLYRVMLLRSFKDNGFADEEWSIRTESGIDWPQPWGKPGFLAVADRMLRAG